MDEVRVLVVDDHPLFREGVVRTLNEEVDMTVVAEADTAAGAIETARGTLPDVVLLDLKLPDASGLSVVEALQQIAVGVLRVTHAVVEVVFPFTCAGGTPPPVGCILVQGLEPGNAGESGCLPANPGSVSGEPGCLSPNPGSV